MMEHEHPRPVSEQEVDNFQILKRAFANNDVNLTRRYDKAEDRWRTVLDVVQFNEEGKVSIETVAILQSHKLKGLQ